MKPRAWQYTCSDSTRREQGDDSSGGEAALTQSHVRPGRPGEARSAFGSLVTASNLEQQQTWGDQGDDAKPTVHVFVRTIHIRQNMPRNRVAYNLHGTCKST
jgi:hypothetical protein